MRSAKSKSRNPWVNMPEAKKSEFARILAEAWLGYKPRKGGAK